MQGSLGSSFMKQHITYIVHHAQLIYGVILPLHTAKKTLTPTSAYSAATTLSMPTPWASIQARVEQSRMRWWMFALGGGWGGHVKNINRLYPSS